MVATEVWRKNSKVDLKTTNYQKLVDYSKSKTSENACDLDDKSWDYLGSSTA